jgi:type I restriction enzyme S subunit
MKEVALGTIGNINPRKPQGLDPESKCSFVPMDHVDDQFGIIAETSERQVADVESGYTYFQESDVLFAKITPCMENGKCAIARNLTNGIGFGSTEFHVIRAKESAIPEWIYYYLRQETTREEARRSMTGSAGQRRVPSGFLRDALIPLPPLPEQQRIAAILGRADRLRRLRRTARELSDTYLQSVFLEMFGDPVTNPMGWDVKPLGYSIDEFEGGVNFPPISDGEECSPWRVLKVSAVTWGDFDPDASKPIRPDVEFDDSIVVRKGDLLISRANTSELVGAACRVRHEPPRVLLPDKIWRVHFSKNSCLLPDYTLFALRHPSLRQIIGSLATGTSGSMKNISKQKAATLPIPLAPISLQQEFAHTVRKFERLRTQQREAERQAEHLFQALLHRAFRGEL